MTSTITAGGLGGAGNVALTIGAPSRRGSTALVGARLGGTDAYVAGSYGTQELSGFHPRLASPDSEIGPNRDKIVARGRWFDRNNGWARGGIDKRVDAVVGAKTWLRARPDFEALGKDAKWADAWATKVESLFRIWANSSRFLGDVERHHHFGGLVRLAYQHYVLDGEACAALYFLDRGGMFSTSVLVMDPDRLANPDGRPDDDRLRMGVELDNEGAAQAYHLRRGHQNDVGPNWDANLFTRIPRETATGRPMFVHVFDKRRAHARRGLGRFTSVMSRMKMLDRYDGTELQAAITNAVFGLYAKTTRDSEGVRDSMAPVDDEFSASSDAVDAGRASFYEQSDLRFDGVRVAVMPDGDEIKTIEANRPGTNFAAFQRAVLNSIASSLGISGEQLSNDWSGINYSSARTLLNEIWRGLSADRHLFTQAFCTPIYAAWLEEAVARFPDLMSELGGQGNFYALRDALTQCEWVGPGRGTIDPLKEANAGQINRDGFVSTLEMDCAEQGVDYRHVLWQRKREQVAIEEYGLVVPPPVKPGPNASADPASNDAADARESAGAER